LFLNTHDDLPVLKDTFPAQIYFKRAHCTDLLMWSLPSVTRDFPGNLITIYKSERTGNVVLLFGTRVTVWKTGVISCFSQTSMFENVEIRKQCAYILINVKALNYNELQ
jgi:hypothetical protein